MKKKFSLYLISPAQKYKHYASGIGMSKLLGKKTNFTPLALPTLAALTPDHYDITIIDEEITEIPKSLPDIVGITTLSSMYERAYEIADEYRNKGIKVILGGPHVSFSPEEASAHADAIVIGEAENTWSICLNDFENQQLKPIYKSETWYEFKKQPTPRWDLIDTSKINSLGIQISRGCPYHCEFCVVSKMYGHKMRYREIDNVIQEIQLAPLKNFFIVDDNLTANKSYIKELLAKVKPLGIQWTCMASIEIAEEEVLLNEMAEAGCKFLVIGFESLNSKSITETRKAQNSVEDYVNAVNKIHRAGIFVFASFIVGFDSDTPKEFERINEFIQKSNIWNIMISILGLTPGSDLFIRMNQEGRWLNPPASLRGGMFPVMQYQNFEPIHLLESYFDFLTKIYHPEDVYYRAIRLFETSWFSKSNKKTGVSLALKIRTTFKLIFNYLIIGEPFERKVFIKLFKSFRAKKISPENLVIFLLIVKGLRLQINEIQLRLPEIKKEIIQLYKKNDTMI